MNQPDDNYCYFGKELFGVMEPKQATDEFTQEGWVDYGSNVNAPGIMRSGFDSHFTYRRLKSLCAPEQIKACDEFANKAKEEKKSSLRPKIVVICGSSRFVGESAVKAWELNKQGIATFFMPLLPQWYPGVQEHHQAEAEDVAKKLDELWLRLIEMADEVFVCNIPIPGHENGYIGERTRIELNYALSIGKSVEYWTPKNK